MKMLVPLPPVEPESFKRVQTMVLEDYMANPDAYDAEDIKKVRDCPYYVERCLQWQTGDVDKATQMVKECFRWRKSSGLIYRTDADFPSEFFASGGLFEYAPDRDGSPVLYMRIKLVKRLQELDDPLKEFIAHQINKLDEKCRSVQAWGLIFDCSDIGFSNVHFDLLTFTINTMINYFTWSVKYIIALEVPWILNKIQKIVLAMLPDVAKKLVRFETKKSLTAIIAPENLPDYLGGTCSLAYQAVPCGCESLEKMGAVRYNFNEKQLDKLKKHYAQLIPLQQ